MGQNLTALDSELFQANTWYSELPRTLFFHGEGGWSMAPSEKLGSGCKRNFGGSQNHKWELKM